MMKCPYNVTELYIDRPSEPTYRRIDTEHEDSTPYRIHLTNNGTTFVKTRTFADCLGTDCAAWQNGRCVRRS